MSFRHFRNSKAARRFMSEIQLNIFAVNNRLKPAYLWDSFAADPLEIYLYLEELQKSGVIEDQLKVIVVAGTVFVVHIECVRAHLGDLLSQSYVQVVDVSKHNQLPVPLSYEDKRKVLQHVVDCFNRNLLTHIDKGPINLCFGDEPHSCNITTLFGALLGYPVLYWYDHLDTSAETCLSMVPLRVHQVFASVKQAIPLCKNRSDNIPTTKQHELYSFSAPEMFSNIFECLIRSWVGKVKLKQIDNRIFDDIHMVSHTVTLSSVIL